VTMTPAGPRDDAMRKGRQADSARRRQRVIAAISQASADGTEISVSSIARAANVDRTFLYRHRDLLAQVHAREALPSARPAAGPAVTRASLQADLLAAHERSTRLAARIRQLEHRLSDALGEQVWRESGLGQPDDIGQLKQQVTHLAEENHQLRGSLAERDQDLAAARAASRAPLAASSWPASIRAADGRCGATYIRCGHSDPANRSAPSTSRLPSAIWCRQRLLLRPAVRMQHGASEQASWAFRGLAGGFGRDGAGWRPVRSGGCCSRVGAPGLIGMACLPARRLGHPEPGGSGWVWAVPVPSVSARLKAAWVSSARVRGSLPRLLAVW